MFHGRIRSANALDGPSAVHQTANAFYRTPIHRYGCGCRGCALDRDPIRYANARRNVRVQAVVLLGFTAAFCVLVAVNLPGIAAAFGGSR